MMEKAFVKGWKDISAFLQISEKTARRHYVLRNLPVKYIGKSPWAEPAKLLDWMQKTSTPGRLKRARGLKKKR